MDQETEPLLSYRFYEPLHRPVRDNLWRRLYVWLLVLSVTVGAFCLLNKSSELSILANPKYLDDPANCPYLGPQPSSDQLLSKPTLQLPLIYVITSASSVLTKHAPAANLLRTCSIILISCCATATFISLGFTLLLRRRAGLAVMVAIAVQILAPLAAGVVLLHAGSPGVAYTCLAVAALLGLSCYLNSDALDLVARLLGISASALSRNSGLIMMIALLKAAMTALLLFMVAGALASTLLGQALPNPVRVPEAGDHCISPTGEMVQCCVWQGQLWVLAYLPLVAIMCVWTLLLASSVKVFIISGTIAQWYFKPVGSRSQSSVTTPVRHALGPSLGSLVLASLLLTAVTHVRPIFCRSSHQRRGRSLLASLFGCCCTCLMDLLQMLTKFTTVYMAMTGAGFFQSGREVMDLLKRNTMDVMSVWWLPPLVLHLPNFFVSCGMSCAVHAVCRTIWADLDPDTLAKMALLLSLACGFLTWLILSFFTSLLLNIVDAVFICYAVDRDSLTCSQAQVHSIYSNLPACGRPTPGFTDLDSHPAPLSLLLLPSDSYPFTHALTQHRSHAGLSAAEYCMHNHSPPSPLGAGFDSTSFATLHSSWYTQPAQSHQPQPYLPGVFSNVPHQLGPAAEADYPGRLAGSHPGLSSWSSRRQPGFDAMAPPNHIGVGGAAPYIAGHSTVPGLGSTSASARLVSGPIMGRDDAGTNRGHLQGLVPLGPSPLAYTPSFQVPGNLAAEVPGEETALLD